MTTKKKKHYPKFLYTMSIKLVGGHDDGLVIPAGGFSLSDFIGTLSIDWVYNGNPCLFFIKWDKEDYEYKFDHFEDGIAFFQYREK